MSDTPRTDAEVFEVDVVFVSYDGPAFEPKNVVEPDFARELERENAALREENRKAHDMACEDAVERYRLNGENAALRKVIEDIRNEIENDSIDNSMKAGRVYCILRNARAKEGKS